MVARGGVGVRQQQQRRRQHVLRAVVLTGSVGRGDACRLGGGGRRRRRQQQHGFMARGATEALVGKQRRGGGGGGSFRSVTTMGLPIPIIGGLFTAPVLAIMYVFVAIRFWLGYNKTTFTQQNKAMMVGLWPVLAVASASFRENLKKATL